MDLIERQAAIDALKNERSDWNCDYNVPVDHCIDAIYSVPSAQPARPAGRWEPVMDANENGEPYQSGVSCSECGHVELYETCFCSSCGLDMREEDERDGD